MPYLGNTPTTQNFISGTDYFNGTGAQTAFTLTRTVNSVNDIQVVVNNVVQQPNDAYTLSGTTLTFTSAPSSGTNNVYVRYLSTTLQSITPSYGSIIPSMLNPPNTIYWNTSGNVGIGTTTITSSAGWSPRLVLAGTDTALIVKGGSGQESNFGTSGGLYIDCLGNSTATNNNIVFRNTNVNSSYTALERMRIDSSGNVGIGTSSPTDSAGFGRALDLNGSAGAAYYARTNGSSTSYTAFGNYGVDGYINNRGAGTIQFYNNNAERMRIHPTGEVSIGSTGLNAKLFVDATNQIAVYGNVNGAQVAGYFITGGANYAIYAQSSANYGIYGRTTDAGYGGCIGVAGNGSTYGIIGFANAWGLYTNASISVNGTTYTSDARLKENVVPISNALNTITQLNPVSFDWKANSARGIINNNTPLPDYGMIAQEVEQVLPDIVYEVPVPPKPLENNEPDSLEQELKACKGVDYSRLIPFLTKAIQEQQAMIEELKARIETLEAK